jgi:DNA-directed RNA polymerase subunit RPC12/RpoP
MSAAKVLTCLYCGARVDLVDGQYLCRRCRAEVYFDDHGEEVWRQAERAPNALEEVAA